MNIKSSLKEILLSPAVGTLILLMGFLMLLHWSWTRESFWRPYGDRGKAYETWEQANGAFKVRATAYHEAGVYLPGAYFAFQSKPTSSDEWKEFATFRVDDPIPLPREKFRFVNEDVAYVYMADGYAVTLDGGRSWAMWKPVLPLPTGQSVYWAIKELNVEPDGSGVAYLWRYDEQSKDIIKVEARTQDYGLHWSALQAAAKHNNGMHPTPNQQVSHPSRQQGAGDAWRYAASR